MDLQKAINKYLNDCDHECELCPLNNEARLVGTTNIEHGSQLCSIINDLEAELSAIKA